MEEKFTLEEYREKLYGNDETWPVVEVKKLNLKGYEKTCPGNRNKNRIIDLLLMKLNKKLEKSGSRITVNRVTNSVNIFGNDTGLIRVEYLKYKEDIILFLKKLSKETELQELIKMEVNGYV